MEVARNKRPRQDSASEDAPPLKVQPPARLYSNISAAGDSRQHNGDVLNQSTFNYQASFSGRSEQEWRLKQVLDSLHFLDMNARRDAIPFAADETLEWLLSPDEDEAVDEPVSLAQKHLLDGEPSRLAGLSAQYEYLNRSSMARRATREAARANLQAWLEGRSDAFWICGKAASGKSTLMKYLRSSLLTREALEAADGQQQRSTVVVAEHYFWSPGSNMERSIEGMYRTILYQILEARPNLLESACQQRRTSHLTDPWSEKELQHALAEVSSAGLMIYLFIDGLDECNDDHHCLLRSISALLDLEGVKMCFSSRPWPIFKDSFSKFSSVRLEEISRLDLERYAIAQLRQYSENTNLVAEFQLVLSKDGAAFVDQLVVGAEGVFLWLFLVLRRLGPRIRFARKLSELSEALSAFPRELEVYLRDHVFARISPTWRDSSETAGVLRFCLAQMERPLQYEPLLTGEAFSDSAFGITKQLESRSKLSIRERTSEVVSFIEDCGADLVHVKEVSFRVSMRGRTSEVKSPFVSFTHRSVMDLLETEEMQKLLRERTPAHFDALCRLVRLARLRFIKITALEGSVHFNVLYTLEAYDLLSHLCNDCTGFCDMDIVRDYEKSTIQQVRDDPQTFHAIGRDSLEYLYPYFLTWEFDELIKVLQGHGYFESARCTQQTLAAALAFTYQTSAFSVCEDADARVVSALGHGSSLNHGSDQGIDLTKPYKGRTIWHEFLIVWLRAQGHSSEIELLHNSLNRLQMTRYFRGCLPWQLQGTRVASHWHLVKSLIEHGADVWGKMCLKNHACNDVLVPHSHSDRPCDEVDISDVLRTLVPQQHLSELGTVLEHAKPQRTNEEALSSAQEQSVLQLESAGPLLRPSRSHE